MGNKVAQRALQKSEENTRTVVISYPSVKKQFKGDLRWTEAIKRSDLQYEMISNFSWPEFLDYNNPIIGVAFAPSDPRAFEFICLDGSSSNKGRLGDCNKKDFWRIVTLSPDHLELMKRREYDLQQLLSVRFVQIRFEKATGAMVGIAFFNVKSQVLLQAGLFDTAPHFDSVNIELAEGERLVGIVSGYTPPTQMQKGCSYHECLQFAVCGGPKRRFR